MKTNTATNRPKPPDDLDGEGLMEWQRICDELAAAGRLATTGRAMLVLYVESWAMYRAAMNHVTKHGPVVMHHNKTVGASPFYEVARQQGQQLRRLLNDLGLAHMIATDTGSGDDIDLD